MLGIDSVWAPGIMYVSDRSADSICETALLFLVMKSEYMPSHLVGCESTSVALCVASLIIFAVHTRRWVVQLFCRPQGIGWC
jgi:hypothetical protein